MACDSCWLCNERVQTGKTGRADEILCSSKITIARFMSERGVKDCSSYVCSEPICDVCLSVVFKLDLLTFEADKCLLELQERVAKGHVFVKEDGAALSAKQEAAVVGDNEPPPLVPRIVAHKLTADEIRLWTTDPACSSNEEHEVPARTDSQDTISDIALNPPQSSVETVSPERIAHGSWKDPHLEGIAEAARFFHADSSSSHPGSSAEDNAWLFRLPASEDVLASPSSGNRVQEGIPGCSPELTNHETNLRTFGTVSNDQLEAPQKMTLQVPALTLAPRPHPVGLLEWNGTRIESSKHHQPSVASVHDYPTIPVAQPSISPRPAYRSDGVFEVASNRNFLSGPSVPQVAECQTSAPQVADENWWIGEEGLSDESSGDIQHVEEKALKPKKKRMKPFASETSVRLDSLSIPRSSFRLEDHRFKCQTCDFSSKWPYAMEKHVNEVHLKVKPHECDQCNKRFGSEQGMRTHKNTLHTNAYLSLCPCHGKKFATFRTMRRHLEHEALLKGGKLQECGECGRKVANLERHKQYHAKTKKTCPECHEVFAAAYSLRRHMFDEHGVNKNPSFTCQQCGRFHTTKAMLNRHLVKKHGEELPEGTVFNCLQCSRVFFERVFLEDHLNYHNGEKPHQCPLCDYRTWGRVMLNQHTRKSHNLSATKARRAVSSDVPTKS